MASWEDVRRIVSALPETSEGESRGLKAWRVRKKLVVWERPLRKSDLEALGDAAPDGPILGARVPDVADKEVLMAWNGEVYFTTPHFDGYPAILVQLERIPVEELEELIRDAWASVVPKRMRG